MEWIGMRTPCMIERSASLRMGESFTLRARIKLDIWGGKHVIFSKRAPASGKYPGVVFMVHGSHVALATSDSSDNEWITGRTWSKVLEVGEEYELLAFRDKAEVRIYVNGIDRTNPEYDKVAPGDLNCDVEAFLGMQLYDTLQARNTFKGRIYMVGAYEEAYFNDAQLLRFQKNPNAFDILELPQRPEFAFAERRG